MSEFLERNIRRETRAQYTGWPLGADARRYLYLKYAADAEARRSDRDIWGEIADRIHNEFGESTHAVGMDVGTSSYFLEHVLRRGYKANLVGIDSSTDHFPFLQQDLNLRYPDASILLAKSDAQSLREIEIPQDDLAFEPVKLKIGASSIDWLTELFLYYHLPDPPKAYSAAYRVLKPDALAIFASRGITNQGLMWRLVLDTAEYFNADTKKYRESFYYHYDINKMHKSLANDSRFHLIEEPVRQEGQLWIPNTDEGWDDLRAAIVGTLWPLVRKDGKRVSGKAVADYLDKKIRPDRFEPYAEKNHGFYVDFMDQAYFVCRTVK